MLQNNTMLNYLFIAETYSGNIIKQTPEDVSKIRPHDKSAYYDVINENIKKFSLVGRGHIFSVNLNEGTFEVDGNKLYTKLPPKKAKLELIYYRQVQQTLKNSPDGIVTKEPVIRYFIGWQTNVEGKNYKFEMGID